MFGKITFTKFIGELFCLLSFVVTTKPHSSHNFHGAAHSSHADHIAFLGKELAGEFDKLTPQESRRRLRMLVPKIDINKDGFVELAELEIWVRHKMKKWTVDEDIDAQFRDLDTNNNDRVSWREYIIRTFGFPENEMHEKWERPELEQYVQFEKRKWGFADQNKDGELSRKEYEWFIHPKEHAAMMSYVALEVLTEADKDKDGFLSVDEYLEWLDLPAFRRLDIQDFRAKYDKNHDGKLDLKEVEEWRRPRNFNKAQGEAEHLIEYADKDGDGKLTAEEIVTNHEFFVGSVATQYGQSFHDEF